MTQEPPPPVVTISDPNHPGVVGDVIGGGSDKEPWRPSRTAVRRALLVLLVLAVVAVPVTTVRPSETERQGSPSDRLDKTAVQVDKKSSGLPVGVQLAGAPFTDERVLSLMLALEEALRAGGDQPRVPRAPT